MSYELLPTPNPSEFAVRVWVSTSQAVSKLAALVEGVTTLVSLELGVVPTSEGIGSYVYLRAVGPDDQGRLGLVFGKNKTEAEKNTPYDSWTESGNHYWHPVLLSVRFYPDTNFPLSTNGPDGGIILASRLYDRVEYVPAQTEGTLFQHDFFLSSTKFVIGQNEVPVPRAVQWSYHGSEGSFPECIGPKLNFPAMRTAYAAYSTGGGAVSASGSAPGQSFPACNFEQRRPYVLRESQQQLDSGLWQMERVTVFPPPDSDVIRK